MPKIALAKYLVNFISLLQFALGTIHLRRRQIFTIFDPYPSPIGSFLLLSVSKFGQFLTPPPPTPKNADVLNGWSLTVCTAVFFPRDLLLRPKLTSIVQY